jgi:uncharacterized protein YcnI
LSVQQMWIKNAVGRVAAVAATVCVLALAGALPASAHVTVNPRSAEQGGYAKFSFRVPTERDVPTTKLEVAFPTDHPLASVSVRPTPGWQAAVTRAKLATPIKSGDGDITEAVSKITWTGGSIKPGEFQEFDVSMGPLPEADSLVFKALQTYADGQVVRWIESAEQGQAEPEHPAPVLTLQPAAATQPGAAQGAGQGAEAASPANPTSTSTTGSRSDGVARWLGGAGLA